MHTCCMVHMRVGMVVITGVFLLQAGPSVRHKCLQAIMRMIYYANAELLHTVLTSANVSR